MSYVAELGPIAGTDLNRACNWQRHSEQAMEGKRGRNASISKEDAQVHD